MEGFSGENERDEESTAARSRSRCALSYDHLLAMRRCTGWALDKVQRDVYVAALRNTCHGREVRDMLAALESAYRGFFHAKGRGQLGLSQIVPLPKADKQPSDLFCHRESQPSRPVKLLASTGLGCSRVIRAEGGDVRLYLHRKYNNKSVNLDQPSRAPCATPTRRHLVPGPSWAEKGHRGPSTPAPPMPPTSPPPTPADRAR